MLDYENELNRFSFLLDYYLAKNGFVEGEEDRDLFCERFFDEYYDRIMFGTCSKLEIALQRFYEEEDFQQKVKHAHTILKYDPDYLLARYTIILDRTHNIRTSMESVLKDEEKRLLEKGYPEGKYWDIYDTCAYIRMMYQYMQCLIDDEDYNAAVETGEKIMRLMHRDDINVRFSLMHLYAFLNMDEKAKHLYDNVSDQNSCMFLIPLSYLSFKNGNMDEAQAYFRQLTQHNRDTVRYLRALKNDRTYDFEFEDEESYRPDTWEEICYRYDMFAFFYDQRPEFLKWLFDQVRIRKK